MVFVKDPRRGAVVAAEADVRSLVQPAPVVTDNARALDVLKAIRASTVTWRLSSTSTSLRGDRQRRRRAGSDHRRVPGGGAGGAGLYDASRRLLPGGGWMPIDEFADEIGGPTAGNADYETVAGLATQRAQPPARGSARASASRAGRSKLSISTDDALTSYSSGGRTSRGRREPPSIDHRSGGIWAGHSMLKQR